jgi:tetratricopeptide (TPR) repeat protein
VRHGEAAIGLDPERLGTRAVAAALNYRTAILARNERGAEAAEEAARAVLEEDPAAATARRVVIDALIRREADAEALSAVEAALEHAPDSLEFNLMRAQLLARTDDQPALGAHLKAMYERFPENEMIRAELIRWYITRREFDAAEAFLRAEAGSPGEDSTGHVAVVELLRRTQGPEAALAELEALIEQAGEGAAAELYRGMRASLDFEAGRRDEAIAALQAVLEGAEPSDQTRRLRVMLARMLESTENPVGAREQIERVLEEDPSHVEALKIRGGWAIREDRPGPAIIDLRTALDQAPRDTAILMLMAEAHMRDGSPELAQERLSLAVQVSDGGAQESVAYARFLMARDRAQQAETILINARRAAPENLEVLGLLGEIHLRNQQWPQAQEIIEVLRGLGTPQAESLAQVYQSGILLGQNRIDEGLDYLRDQLDTEADGDLGPLVQLVRTQILTGRFDEARAYVDEELEKRPDSVPLQLLSANIHALQGQLEEAEELYRDLLARQPDIEPAVLQLQALLRATERESEAEALIERSLKVLPKSRRLRLLEAYRLERSGRTEEAIAVYEILYREDSSDVVVANNLASMLSNFRDSEEDLERAHAIARRLTGSDVPAFQDTLGWILFKRGDIEGAIARLEPAAAALPEEPSVTVHLGLAYAAAGRTEEARAALERGIALAGETEAPWLRQAKEALAAL